MKLDTLDIGGCEEAFDYLMLNDLVTLGQTCKRLNRVVGYILQEYYPGVGYACYENAIHIENIPAINQYASSKADRKFFHEFIHNLALHEKTSFQYLCNSQPKLPRIKRMEFFNVELTTVMPDTVKTTFAKLETLTLYDCEFDGNFHELLALCPKLKRLVIHQYPKRGFLIGDGNEWLAQQYPKLEYFEIYTHKSMVEQLKIFLELNRNIRKLSTSDLLIMSDLWTDSDLRLDELELKYCVRVGDALCNQLNSLHERDFYKRLNLGILENNPSSAQLCSINGLVNVDLSYPSAEAIQFSLLPNLEEISTWDADQIADFHALPTSLKKLERLRMTNASSDDIFPFICQAEEIKSIWVDKLRDGLHFNTYTNIIELNALNLEREKLIEAQKVTIYVKEKIYVATKWALKETDFSLIKLKRIESGE